ncbi:MAG: uroporphyrinogen-III C-methyltransferase [Halofilum sp. (in: g-proteobacteria)]|nr:uroporphyrinogen-III C-methyltransferase [Halofilum sp. (in: g-proteobacteria)]
MSDPHRPDEPQDPAADPQPEADDAARPRPDEPGSGDDAGAPDADTASTAAPDEPRGPEEATGDGAGEDHGAGGAGAREADAEDAPAAEGGADDEDAADSGRDGDGHGGGRERRPGRAIAVALLVLVLLALAGGGGWLGWRLYQVEQQLAQVPAARAEALQPLARQGALEDAVGRLEGEIEQLAARGSDATREVAERVDQLEEAVKTVRELAGRGQVDWRMAEVHYLLSVGARRLAIAGDRSAAIAALQAADRSLAALGDVRLVELRQAIVEDITAIRQVTPADVEGIALRIQSLLQRVPDLPPPAEPRTVAVDEPETDGDTIGGPRDWWASIKQRLSQYVVIRRQPGAGEPPRPSPDTTLPAAEKLGFALAEARRAALRHDSDAYTAAIARARDLLESGFAADTPTTRRFADALAGLAEQPVVTTYPDLTATLEQAERAAARLRTQREQAAADEDEEG